METVLQQFAEKAGWKPAPQCAIRPVLLDSSRVTKQNPPVLGAFGKTKTPQLIAKETDARGGADRKQSKRNR